MERQNRTQVACRFSTCAAVMALLLCSGCMVGPDYHRPGPGIDLNYSYNHTPELQGQTADISQWWIHFYDPVLHQLICETSAANLTIREAGQRIIESRARRDIAEGNLFPQSQTLDGGYSKSKISSNDANFFTAPGVFDANVRPANWQAGLNASWELDFWGRYRRAVEAADAGLEASMAAYDETRILLMAEVGRTYVELRTMESRLDIAQQAFDVQQATLEIARQKQEAGIGSAVDTSQAEVNLRQTEATLPQLEIARRQASHRLCTLQGKRPADVSKQFGWLGCVPRAESNLTFRIPADLLRQRPDVRRAERNLAMQSAKIGMAEADFYPRITLIGNIGYSADNLGRLFEPGSQVGLVASGFSWNILNYGRISNSVRAEQAVFEQLCLAYKSAVLNAAREAEDALVAYHFGFQQTQSLEQSAQASIVAVEKSLDLYRAGSIDFGRIYILQSETLRQRDNLAVAQRGIALSLIDLFKSMGGGWKVSPPGGNQSVMLRPPVTPEPSVTPGPPAIPGHLVPPEPSAVSEQSVIPGYPVPPESSAVPKPSVIPGYPVPPEPSGIPEQSVPPEPSGLIEPPGQTQN
jgi:NodT family efflux transporter outer membrane factor (OMF) lipoprotein